MAMNMNAALNIKANVEGVNNIVSLNRGLAAVEGTAKGVTGAMRGLAGASAGLSGALGALAPLASVAGLVGLAKNALEAGDALNDMSQRTGVSVEALARFKKAAAVSGTDLDTVAKGLNKLSKNMLDAATGNDKAAASFAAMGIKIKDASGQIKSSDRVMLELADRFSKMKDSSTKTGLAMDLFGKKFGPDLIPMLNMGGDAIDKLSVKMTTAFAQRADEYSDKLAMLSGKVGALGADLLIALLPALEKITDAVSGAVDAFNKLPGPVKATAVAGAILAISWGPITGLIRGAGAAFAIAANGLEILRYQAALAGGVMPLLSGGIEAVSEAIYAIPGWGWALAGVAAIAALSAALYKNNSDFKNWVDNVANIVSNDFQSAMKSIAESAQSAFKTAADAGDWFSDQMKNVAASIPQGFADGFAQMVQYGQQAFQKLGTILFGWWNSIPAPIRGMISGTGKALGNALQMVPGVYPTVVAFEALGKGPVNKGKGKNDGKNPNLSPDVFTPNLSALDTGAKDAADKAARLAAEREKLRLDLIASQEQFTYLERQKEINDLLLQENDLRARGLITATSATHLKVLDKQEKLEELKIETELQKKLADARKEMDPQSRALKEQIAYTDSIVKKAEARLKLQQDQKLETQATTQALKQQAQEQAKAIGDIRNRTKYAIIGATQGSEQEQRQREIDDYKRRIQEANGRGNADEAKRLQEQLDALMQQFKEMDALANNAGFGFAKGIRGYLDGIGSLADSIANVTKNVFQGLEDKLVEFVTTGKASFKDFANEIIKQLIRIAIQQAIMKPLLQGIGSLFGGFGGGGGGLLGYGGGSAFKLSANGNVFAANGIVPYAMGGIVDRPTIFPFAKGVGLMGEAGPEAIIPLRRGADGRLGVAGGGGSTNVTVNVDAKGSSVQGDSGKGNQLARVVAAAVQAEMIKQKRPGGLLAA
jgi:hypothetical protein